MKKKKTKKNLLSNIIIASLLITGLGIMLYPTISDLWIRHQLEGKVKDYTALAAEQEDLSAYWKAAEAYNDYLRTKDSQFKVDDEEKEWIKSLLSPKGTDMMGSVEIDKINVNIPIYKGTEETQLQSGAGWWYGSSLPTGTRGSHAIITAHSGLVKAKLFTDLEKLEVGDKFTIRVLDKEFEYTVVSVKVTLPEENEDLFIVDDKDYVTLYTCTPIGVNDHRLLVRGERNHNLPKKSESSKTGLSSESGTFLILLSGSACIALLGLTKIRKDKEIEEG